ncbi:glyoxal oxidase-related protein [Perilla frutescens var. hirtella]|nr:glyoxal oxidase-related protein [Perilla frutescens var. hirtella]
MAAKNLSLLFLLVIFQSLHTPTLQLRPQRRRYHPPSRSQPHNSTTLFHSISRYSAAAFLGGGEWVLLQKSVGVSAMHMQLLYDNKVVIFDRTDFGLSNLTLPQGKCRHNDEAVPVDCTAHSLLYDVSSNTFRPLMVQTDVWCSSAAVDSDGALIQTGGYHAGDHKIRLFVPCSYDQCDWIELNQTLTVQRWYSSDQILPDGRVIIVGGRRAFSYEFFPKNEHDNGTVHFPFLKETTDPKEENNLYPFLHLLPDGNLFVFANQRSVLLDYKYNKIITEFPPIPGEKRSYPATGSSVMLPVKLIPAGRNESPAVEVMVCGGAWGGAYLKAVKGVYTAAAKSCGRIRVTDHDPKWEMEDMPMNRVMPDMLLLPSGDVIILNGAGQGTAGWECATDPVLNPILYRPDEPEVSRRFTVLNPTAIPRLYHSSATLLPDGRILVGGSNPHMRYNFTGVEYPTELSLEAFSPPYLGTEYSHLRPSILSMDGLTDNLVSYGQEFAISFSLGPLQDAAKCMVTMVAPSFTTHSFAMNQRLLVLYIENVQQVSAFAYKATLRAPPNANVAPPGYYMLFLVHQGVPCHCVWIRIR